MLCSFLAESITLKSQHGIQVLMRLFISLSDKIAVRFNGCQRLNTAADKVTNLALSGGLKAASPAAPAAPRFMDTSNFWITPSV